MLILVILLILPFVYVLSCMAGVLLSALFYVGGALVLCLLAIAAATIMLSDGLRNGDDIQQ